jgi:hypothetical protein
MFCSLLFILPAGFLSAQSATASGSIQYVVEDLQGSASVQKADGTSVAAKEGLGLATGDVFQLDENSQAVLMLNDDTTLWLGPGGKLNVSSLDPSSSGGFLSKLKLLGGRLFSQVQKLRESNSLFEVEGGGVVCGVRGTAFEMELQGDDLETRTHEGEVLVTTNGKSESVKAGHVFAFRRGLLRMQRRLDRAETDRFSKWKGMRSSIREKRLKRLREWKRRQLLQQRLLRHPR